MSAVRPKNLRDLKRKLITSAEQIPEEFPSYEAEAEFWETHELAEELLEDGPEVRAEFYRKLGIKDQRKGEEESQR